MIALLLATFAWAAEPPTCGPLPPLERGSVSVAWVARGSARVWAGSHMTVVPTRALRAWARTERAGPGRVLQGLGLRKRARDPARPWVVGVFEVPVDALCRPIHPEADLTSGDAGVPLCARGARGAGLTHDDCGRAVDRATGSPSLPVYRIRWRDAAARGFCVLPLERFLAGE